MPKVTVKKTGVTLTLMQSQMNNINRETYQETGEWFHGKYINKRFTIRGSLELGYVTRKPVTNLIKQKLFGHKNPNVFTGESRDRSRVRNVRARATRKRAESKIKLNAPKLNYKNPKSKIHPASEVRRVSDAEALKTSEKLARTKEKKIEQFAKGN